VEVNEFIKVEHYISVDRGQVELPTAEGVMLARIGDWIICGTQGEYYPCKPQIFAEVYEPQVDEQDL